MNIAELEKLIRLLEGQTITFKTLAANSLLVHFNGPPGTPDIWTLWLEPPWRYLKHGEIAAGSDDHPYHNAETTQAKAQAEFDDFCRLLDPICGASVEKISIDKKTRDLHIEIAGDQTIRTFTCARNEEIWRFVSDFWKVCVYPLHLEVEQLSFAN